MLRYAGGGEENKGMRMRRHPHHNGVRRRVNKETSLAVHSSLSLS